MAGSPTPQPADEASPELRARLTAAGRLIGIQVTLTNEEQWEFTDDEVRVGLGFHAARGHGPDETVALALLELWASARVARAAPEHARRSRAISRVRPELAPLVAAVDRLLATGDLLTAMPAVRGPLSSAVVREVPEDLQHWPTHLQWVGAILRRGTADVSAIVAPAVTRELRRLDRRGETSPGGLLRRIMQPAVGRTPRQRFERALAALTAPYLRLLTADRHGVDDVDGHAVEASNADETADLGLGRTESSSDDAHERSDAADDAQSDSGGPHAREGDERSTAEISDLYAAEHAAFVSTVLPTPMPTAGALVDALLDTVPEGDAAFEPTSRTPERSQTVAAPGGTALSGALRDYRLRVQRHADTIEATRQLWHRVISQRVSVKPGLSRTASAEGEVLAVDALAVAVADVHAGVAEPLAFRQRTAQARRARAAGYTDYVLLVDRSGSMHGPQSEHAADAALIMLEALAGAARDIDDAQMRTGVDLGVGLRTCLIVFDAEATVVKPLAAGIDDASRAALHGAVRRPSGATNDGAALHAAAAALGLAPGMSPSEPDGLERRRIVILISDGGTNDPHAAAREAQRLRASGVHLWGIGLGTDEVVKRYAPTSRRVDDPRELPRVLHDIIEREIVD